MRINTYRCMRIHTCEAEFNCIGSSIVVHIEGSAGLRHAPHAASPPAPPDANGYARSPESGLDCLVCAILVRWGKLSLRILRKLSTKTTI